MKLYLCCIPGIINDFEGFAIDENGKFVLAFSGSSKEEMKERLTKYPMPDVLDYEKEWIELNGRAVNHEGLRKALIKAEGSFTSLTDFFIYY